MVQYQITKSVIHWFYWALNCFFMQEVQLKVWFRAFRSCITTTRGDAFFSVYIHCCLNEFLLDYKSQKENVSQIKNRKYKLNSIRKIKGGPVAAEFYFKLGLNQENSLIMCYYGFLWQISNSLNSKLSYSQHHDFRLVDVWNFYHIEDIYPTVSKSNCASIINCVFNQGRLVLSPIH